MKRVKIIGLGNPYRGDDGVGLAVIAELKKLNLPRDIEIIDSGADDLGIFEHLKNCDHLIIIDAISADKAPGTIMEFNAERLNGLHNTRNLDIHSFGLAGAIELAKKMKVQGKITVVGIEPENTDLVDKLSDLINSKIPELIKAVKQLINFA
jgi:hydrogenase maturation protease